MLSALLEVTKVYLKPTENESLYVDALCLSLGSGL
jgi:hypothetical protein